MRMSYKFLGEIYRNYRMKKLHEAFFRQRNTHNLADLEVVNMACIRLGISQETFIETYVKPWQGLDILTMKQIAKALVACINSQAEIPIEIKIESKEESTYRVLDWLTVHLLDLQLNEFAQGFFGQTEANQPNDWVNAYISHKFLPYNRANLKPYRQCYYCGQLNQDERNKKFNKKNKYCHKADCNHASPNPDDHRQGCCYKTVALARKVLKQKLKRKQVQKNSQKEMENIFAKFVKNRLTYIANNIKNDVRTEGNYILNNSSKGQFMVDSEVDKL